MDAAPRTPRPACGPAWWFTPFEQDFIAETLRWECRGHEATVFLDDEGHVLGAIYFDRRPGNWFGQLMRWIE